MNKEIIIIVAALVLAGLAVAGYFYWGKNGNVPAIPVVEDVIPSINPNPMGDKTPDINPVDKANPFKDIYINPFK